ncbi:MAG TPA: YciK family oxidoreductase, partial [Gammaproteobacteria bacterium]|nr:YciK family oxidoreductase [Gammaproteobacteria bacterium]
MSRDDHKNHEPRDWLEYAPSPGLLEDRIILVTGATSGIGLAVSRALLRRGATVILHGRDSRKLDTAHEELKRLGPEPVCVPLDLERAQGPDYQRLVDSIEARFGRLDGLLHNAAILGDRSPIEHYDIGLWQRVMHVNVNASFILTRCLVPLLRLSQDATIVFSTSTVGHVAKAYWGAYAVSKFATEGLAQILAVELEHARIRVNYINPGATRTSMRRRAYPAEDPASLKTPEEITTPYLY